MMQKKKETLNMQSSGYVFSGVQCNLFFEILFKNCSAFELKWYLIEQCRQDGMNGALVVYELFNSTSFKGWGETSAPLHIIDAEHVSFIEL